MKLLASAALFGLLAAPAFAEEAKKVDAALPDLKGKTLTIVSWGGAYSASQKRAYDEPFAAATGVKILNEDKSNDALAITRAQAEAKNITWDVVDMLQADAQRACNEGLLVKFNWDEWFAPGPDGKSAKDDFIANTTGECFIPSILYSTLFAYNTELFPDEAKAPKTIADVWDVKKFPGKRGLEKTAGKNLEWALIADGVATADVYKVLATKEGQDRAFASLDKIKANVIWWDKGAQAPQLLADKEVSIVSAYNGRIFNAQVVDKKPMKIMWDNHMFEADGWAVPAGHTEEKMKDIKAYLRFATDTQRLADQAKFIAYGPARLSSAPLVGKHADTGEEMKPHMPTSPDNFKHAFRFDPDFWADYGDVLDERFKAWLAK